MSTVKITRTISEEALAMLERLAEEDCQGRRPNESATLEGLIRAEEERRRRRRERGATTSGETPAPPRVERDPP